MANIGSLVAAELGEPQKAYWFIPVPKYLYTRREGGEETNDCLLGMDNLNHLLLHALVGSHPLASHTRGRHADESASPQRCEH